MVYKSSNECRGRSKPEFMDPIVPSPLSLQGNNYYQPLMVNVKLTNEFNPYW